MEHLKNYWYPLMIESELKHEPVSHFLLDHKLVIYRGGQGIVVQRDLCPHRKYPLSQGKIVDGVIECGYHGWQFDSEGYLLKLPGSPKLKFERTCSSLKTYSAQVHEGLIWVCLNEDISFRPTPQNVGQRHIYQYSRNIEGETQEILENFLDPLHTAFVHDGIIRSTKKRNKTFIEVRPSEHGVEAKYTEEGRQTGIIGGLLGRSVEYSVGRFSEAHVIDLEYFSAKGLEMTNRFIITRNRGHHHTFFSQVSFRKSWIPNRIKLEILRPFLVKALRQDVQILKNQWDNFEAFPDQEIKRTHLDIMRPYIDQIYAGQKLQVESHDLELYL